jgi:Predicted RNA polymerase sigma factor containing a TPR repeat domain
VGGQPDAGLGRPGGLIRGRVGRYALQAAIASLHSEADSYAATDWRQVLGLYDELLKVWPTPVVAATAYRAALDLTDNVAEREFLATRLAAVDSGVDSGSGRSS